RWVRTLMRNLAAEGRTVLLSSHLMSEMAQTADRLIVIGRGRILADDPIADVISGATRSVTRVRTHESERLMATIAGPGVVVSVLADGAIEVSGLTAEQVAVAASTAGIVLHEIASMSGSLEEAYIALTAGEVEYRSSSAAGTGAHK